MQHSGSKWPIMDMMDVDSRNAHSWVPAWLDIGMDVGVYSLHADSDVQMI